MTGPLDPHTLEVAIREVDAERERLERLAVNARGSGAAGDTWAQAGGAKLCLQRLQRLRAPDPARSPVTAREDVHTGRADSQGDNP